MKSARRLARRSDKSKTEVPRADDTSQTPETKYPTAN
jgi:hypothetical protein